MARGTEKLGFKSFVFWNAENALQAEQNYCFTQHTPEAVDF